VDHSQIVIDDRAVQRHARVKKKKKKKGTDKSGYTWNLNESASLFVHRSWKFAPHKTLKLIV
jgi:hypothetical protein